MEQRSQEAESDMAVYGLSVDSNVSDNQINSNSQVIRDHPTRGRSDEFYWTRILEHSDIIQY